MDLPETPESRAILKIRCKPACVIPLAQPSSSWAWQRLPRRQTLRATRRKENNDAKSIAALVLLLAGIVSPDEPVTVVMC